MNKRLSQCLFTLPTVSDMNERDVNTRQQHRYLPKCNTCLGVKSLQVAGPSFWNTLPYDVTDANFLVFFINYFKMYLLRHQF